MRRADPDHRSFDALGSPAWRRALDAHYDVAHGIYKLWASPRSVASAVLGGWQRSAHPAQLHYGWDLEAAPSLDAAIRATTDYVFAQLALPDSGPALDVLEPGCGIGGAVTQLARQHAHLRFHGISLVERQMGIARSRADAAGLRNAHFARASFVSLPYRAECFDGLYAIEALCYCPVREREAMLREFARAMRPGARLAVLDGYTRRPPDGPAEARILQDVLDGWTLPPPGSPGAFSDAAQAAGLELVREEEVTSHILASAQRIRAIGAYLLAPLAMVARVPGAGRLLSPLGFASARGAARFADACRSQVQLFECGLGGYWLHVFRKPAVIG